MLDPPEDLLPFHFWQLLSSLHCSPTAPPRQGSTRAPAPRRPAARHNLAAPISPEKSTSPLSGNLTADRLPHRFRPLTPCRDFGKYLKVRTLLLTIGYTYTQHMGWA
ncbi:hypothetical protein PAHAL_2G204500 [Panicum hallii]|uniref:Uncharacterized protein n=1 Tax=Panicum hallii TaxID=206008 RepID=A0A2T8KPR9_9POAL|nr:hypothetical protein PAHAL_2G204500 [Panicum hallii]